MMFAPLVFGALMDGGHYRGVWIGVALMLGLLIATAVNVHRNERPGVAAAA
jgi:MFS transporter, FSR family, fosmidomycin resistance protein